jgi:hypothetical protein
MYTCFILSFILLVLTAFMYDLRRTSSYPSTTDWDDFLPCLVVLALLWKSNWQYLWGPISGLRSAASVCRSVCRSVASANSSGMAGFDLTSVSPASFFFCSKIDLALLDPLNFYVNFMIISSISEKMAGRILTGIVWIKFKHCHLNSA